MENVLSLDIDLGRIHAWSFSYGQVMYKSKDMCWGLLESHDVILAEIASPVFYGSYNKAEITNRMKWALYNGVTIGRIFERMCQLKLEHKLLVAPSSAWTLGHPEEMRNIVAGVTGENNHDIRECRCMQYYFKTNPGQWKSLPDYLASLQKGKQ